MLSTVLRHLIPIAWIFFCSSALSAHVLHAYKQINRTHACSSFSLEERLMLLSLYMPFSFASAAAVCAVLARTLVFEPSPRYFS